ncbi:MAG TPA: DUF1570 domain-containing protein, partial [Phycisphaerae bacterium]
LGASAAELVGHAFKTRRTDHFVVAYDASDLSARDLCQRLEATFDGVLRFCRFNGIPCQSLAQRLEVYFFASYAEFDAYARSLGSSAGAWSGFYYSGNNRAAFYDSLDDPLLRPLLEQIEGRRKALEPLAGEGKRRSANSSAIARLRQELARLERQRDEHVERRNRLIVQHEAAHQILYNLGVHVIGGQNPNWLTEGLACLFETPPGNAGAGAVALNQLRLRDFRDACQKQNNGARLTDEQVRRAMNTGEFAPLRELVGDVRMLLDQENRSLIYRYAQAWSLVCYLQRARRAEFADYLRALAQRPVGREFTPAEELADFERAFGPLDETFERRWANYILGLDFKPNDAR